VFLPTVLGLKKPKDASPRKMLDGMVVCQIWAKIVLLKIDEEGYDQVIVKS
jgi:hypothetical protein